MQIVRNFFASTQPRVNNMNATTNSGLDAAIAAFEEQKADLEKNHLFKFVVFKDEIFVGAWDTLEAAASAASAKYGRGPFLIRQVGVPIPKLPASVMFRPMMSAM